MKTPSRQTIVHLAAALPLFLAAAAPADVTVTESRRKFEGAERTVVHMENERITVEVVPELEGRVINYRDKSKPGSGFEWLDDCPYHFMGKWEGVPFSYKIDSKGPDRGAVTVTGGGKIAVALLRHLTGVDVANPIELKVERTVTIVPNSTRLRIDVKITNTGEGVAPSFRYMVHCVFGQVPPMAGGRAYWFLPTDKAVEFFDEPRGLAEMWTVASGAPLDHPFSRFIPGRHADKPRYVAGGWGAVLTSAGPAYIEYDVKQYDFIQYWFGGDSEWHYTFEPHTRPVDLKPGESTTCSFTLAYDSKEITFNGPTMSYAPPVVPEALQPGGTLRIRTRATTVQSHAEKASLKFEATGPDGATLLTQQVEGELNPFIMTELAAEAKVPVTASLGMYKWKMSDGQAVLASGQFEVVTPDEQAKRVTLKATAALQAKLDAMQQQLSTLQHEKQRVDELWREGTDLALTWNDERFWSVGAPTGAVAVALDPAGVPVLGDWKSKEAVRIKELAAVPAAPWPADAEKVLAALGSDRALVRDIAVDAGGKGFAALVVDGAHNRCEVIRLGGGGIVKRFGEFSDKPTEIDAKLGSGARALTVDSDGNIWVATNAWGKVSVLVINQDGAPAEQAVIGAKGALKKFSPDGNLLGAIGLLTVPADLSLAVANGVPVVLAPYRHVSMYHDTQVREGVMLVRVANTQRMTELKMPGGSVAVDKSGRLWAADVAGHVACFDASGHRLFDVKNSPAPAVHDAVLPAGSPLPVMLRAAPAGGVWSLSTLKHSFTTITAEEAPALQEAPASAGALLRLIANGEAPAILGESALWQPGK
jgi:hypothetical protein